jgi:hypothetical protein
MSFCNPTYGYNSLVGNCFTTTTPTVTPPAAPFDSVQFNDAGSFGGDSSFTFDSNTTTLTVPTIDVQTLNASISVTPTIIYDSGNNAGTTGQYLESTGTGLQWTTPPITTPAAPFDSVQYNDSGNFAGDSSFTFDSSTSTLTVDNVDAAVSVKPTTIIDSAISTGSSGKYLESTGTGVLWSVPPVTTPAAPFDSVQYNDSGNFAGDSSFTFDSVTSTLSVNNVDAAVSITPTTIIDLASSTGTSGQYLESTGTGVQWSTFPTFAQESFLIQNTNGTVNNDLLTQTAFKGTLTKFNATQGRYFFELQWTAINMNNLVNTGLNWEWVIPTGTIDINYRATIGSVGGISNAGADQDRIYETIAASTFAATAAQPVRRVYITGIITVTSSTAEIQPSFAFTGTAPGTSTRVDNSSYWRLTKVTSDTSLRYLGSWA